MFSLKSPELNRIGSFLAKYDLKSAISNLSGLLTVPSLHANTLRLEVLVHLAVANSKGDRKPGEREIDHWLNRYLGKTQIAALEDPTEDVFLTNVETSEGNRRIFEGTWESNDYNAQIVLDILGDDGSPKACRDMLTCVLALLRLSDRVADRLELRRWHRSDSTPKGVVRLSPTLDLADRARAVAFTSSEIEAMGINREHLDAFVFCLDDRKDILAQSVLQSSLVARPLIDFGDQIILALPAAVSPAIRCFVLSELSRTGYLNAFSTALRKLQMRHVEKEGLRDLRRFTEFLEPPRPDGAVPSLSAWLLKYDVNKYIHVILFHDDLELLRSQGLSTFMQCPDDLSAGLSDYFHKVRQYCIAQPDFGDGFTLVILGGLGRGFVMELDALPDDWHRSIIRVSDLLMLAAEQDQSISRYLKFIKQKTCIEQQGVHIPDVNGDYNHYCYWRRENFQLVPREMPIAPGSMLVIGTDMVLPIRENVRKLVDQHMIVGVDGLYSSTMRFGTSAYFKSVQNRPIFASLSHLGDGELAGAVETPRGPSWLIVKPQYADPRVKRLAYEIWSGFLPLYERLVTEIESQFQEGRSGAIQVSLDLSEVVVPDEYVSSRQHPASDDLAVSMDPNFCAATVVLPREFLGRFQRPDNSGERYLLAGIAKAYFGAYRGTDDEIESEVLSNILNTVIGDSGMRVLHVFHTYYPIERLLMRQDREPIFLAKEDIEYSKIRLSEGCTSASPDSSIESRSQCNKFLHEVVEKIWCQLQALLNKIDRTSAIRELIAVHEAIIQDRDHWERTAKAVLSLYKDKDDVFLVARDRESDRAIVGLAARAILEMAICECPAAGGKSLSRWQLDELLAKATLLIEVATDSDAVNYELVEPKIEIFPNGYYGIEHGFLTTVVRPFLTAYSRESFQDAAESYSKYYRQEPPSERRQAAEVFTADFNIAFQVEFGLTPDEAVDGFAELMDLAVEQDNAVVETSLGSLKARLNTSRGLSLNACDAFIRTFAIFHRSRWDTPPTGYAQKDLYPWRFRRRLSATAKPLFAFGDGEDDKVIFGAGSLKVGFGYLLERSERGHLPQEYFASAQMRQYIGAVSNERGHEFARSIGNKLDQEGWEVKVEVEMTELGGTAELGDIDVLAWKPGREVLLIECKRLQLARTIAEIAEICARFRGDAKDELDRHIQRVKWIKANPAGLQKIVGFTPNASQLQDRLVTNVQVPMIYLTSLPMDAAKIGPLR